MRYQSHDQPAAYLNTTTQDSELQQGQQGLSFVATWFWNPSLLTYVKATTDASGNLNVTGGGGGGGSVTQGTVPWIVQATETTYTAATVTATTSGVTTLLTPGAGNALTLRYMCLSADFSNTTQVVVTVQFSSGSPLYRVALAPGAIWARNIGAGRWNVQGATNATLQVSLSANQTVYASFEAQ